MSDESAALFLVAPDLAGPPTGGTRYNAELLGALGEVGVSAVRIGLDEARVAVRGGSRGRFLLDSLYLDELPALRSLGGEGARIFALVHYLPSLVRAALRGGDSRRDREAWRVETEAVAAASGFVVPSELLRGELERRGARPETILVLEPGIAVRPALEAPSLDRVRALLVGSLVEGKGVLGLFEALARELSAGDRFELCVVGSERAEPEYAQACRRAARETQALRGRVTFDGELAPREVRTRLHESNLFVSASLTESYGMALAEARAAGVPIVAREGGNVSAHVEPESGGELAPDDQGVARACVALSRNAGEHARRLTAARSWAHRARTVSWIEVARGVTAWILA